MHGSDHQKLLMLEFCLIFHLVKTVVSGNKKRFNERGTETCSVSLSDKVEGSSWCKDSVINEK